MQKLCHYRSCLWTRVGHVTGDRENADPFQQAGALAETDTMESQKLL